MSLNVAARPSLLQSLYDMAQRQFLLPHRLRLRGRVNAAHFFLPLQTHSSGMDRASVAVTLHAISLLRPFAAARGGFGLAMSRGPIGPLTLADALRAFRPQAPAGTTWCGAFRPQIERER